MRVHLDALGLVERGVVAGHGLHLEGGVGVAGLRHLVRVRVRVRVGLRVGVSVRVKGEGWG